jgi:hypothetical protein
MPWSRRAWTEDDVAKLIAKAGKVPAEQLAAELGRSVGSVAVKAHELRISLRTIPRGQKGKGGADGERARFAS